MEGTPANKKGNNNEEDIRCDLRREMKKEDPLLYLEPPYLSY